MTMQTRRMSSSFPDVIVARDTDSDSEQSYSDTDSEQSSSDEEDVGSEPEPEPESEVEEEVAESRNGGRVVQKAPITISLKKVCKVCKKPGHEAGFKGATYIDCPMKPCFLCKMPGHTTMSCPHRVSIENGTIPTRKRNASNPMEYVFDRQIRAGVPLIKPGYVIPDTVNCGVLRYHSRRVTCLEFHPTKNNLILSGDKKGQVGVWDYHITTERTMYGNIHTCIINNMKFNPTNDGVVYVASSDGTISCTDMETGFSSSLMNLNPNGWQGPNTWRMLYGMDLNSERGVVLVADNFGFLYMLDMRSNSRVGEGILVHKKGSKVVGLHCNPVQPDLLLSCGNDHFARIWDMRRLEVGSSLAELSHRRVVNSAYFSPLSGNKILTTSQDNRLRVWDSIFGNMETPSREIVHSHDFSRHLTPFKAEWDPKDPSESLAVIGRYISENYNGVALHPIDFIDTSTGQLVAEVTNPSITTISPINKLHPRDDVLASGNSRSIFIWNPREKTEPLEPTTEPLEPTDERKLVICGGPDKKSNKKFGKDSDDSDDDICISRGKKVTSKKPNLKPTPYSRKGKR